MLKNVYVFVLLVWLRNKCIHAGQQIQAIKWSSFQIAVVCRKRKIFYKSLRAKHTLFSCKISVARTQSLLADAVLELKTKFQLHR